MKSFMPNNQILSKNQIDKLGNTMIFLSKKVGEFGLTKALKILFLLQENSIKNFGIPFFDFDFKLWQFGPVVAPVYEELSGAELHFLKGFIKKVRYGDEFLYEAIADFNDDEFSDNDLSILDDMIKFAKHKTASDFVKYTHGKNSLWRYTAIKYDVLHKLEYKEISTTDIDIDFSPLYQNDEFLKNRYEGHLDFQKFNHYVKS